MFNNGRQMPYIQRVTFLGEYAAAIGPVTETIHTITKAAAFQ
jgi:hypothetical protein